MISGKTEVNLICLYWLKIRSEIWQRFLKAHPYISNISPLPQILLTRKFAVLV